MFKTLPARYPQGWGWLLLGVLLTLLSLAGCYRQVVFAPPPKPRVWKPSPARQPQYPRYYVAASRLNMRACPGMDCPKIGLLEYNQVVEKLGESENWYQIRVPQTGSIGWVSSRYLSLTPVSKTKPPEVVSPPPAGIRVPKKPVVTKPEEEEGIIPQVRRPESGEEEKGEPPAAIASPSPARAETPSELEESQESTSPPSTRETPTVPEVSPTAPTTEPRPKRVRIM